MRQGVVWSEVKRKKNWETDKDNNGNNNKKGNYENNENKKWCQKKT